MEQRPEIWPGLNGALSTVQQMTTWRSALHGTERNPNPEGHRLARESKSNPGTVLTLCGFLGLQKACGDQLDQFFSNLGVHQNSQGCFLENADFHIPPRKSILGVVPRSLYFQPILQMFLRLHACLAWFEGHCIRPALPPTGAKAGLKWKPPQKVTGLHGFSSG